MIELIFITSNNEKVAHARHLCRNYDIVISKQKNYGIGYIEPRIDNRDELIAKSVDDAYQRFSKTVSNPDSKYFFIEDTSVIIDSLSNEKEVPGVDVKYWMQENTFESIDAVLKESGNDRRVTVRSDVVLVLPKALQDIYHKKYILFTSSTDGVITSQEHEIINQPYYPWLNSKTFNKWFIPKGCEAPMSLLPINEADKYDFRAGAFSDMLNFLVKNENLKPINEKSRKIVQSQLFKSYFFIVCGPPCAGKSTLASHMNSKFNYFHIEASDYMYLSYYDRHGINSTVKIGDFAQEALKSNPSIVANQIIRDIEKLNNAPIIITGFRSPDEIKCIEEQYSGILAIEVVYIEADQLIRFKRNELRARSDNQKTFAEFKLIDLQQQDMGLLLIKEKTENIIYNNETIDEYLSIFEEMYSNELSVMATKTDLEFNKSINSQPLQNAILLTLLKQPDEFQYFTTTEISHLINQNPDYQLKPKHKDNISRYFNQNYHPYFEIQASNGKASYRLSQTGKALARWLNKNGISISR